MTELLELAAMRRAAALQELEQYGSLAQDIENAYEIGDVFGQASMFCADAQSFCQLADAIGGDNSEAVFRIWNNMDTDPREAVFAQAPTAHQIIHNYAENDNG